MAGSTTAPNWLTPNEMAAWRAYIETMGDLTLALERDLVAHGLPLGDYQVLVYLSEAGGQSMRMCDLADRLHLSPSGLTRRLDGLVKSGLVDRRPSTDDRRVMMAVITDDGFDKLREVAPHHVASVRRHLFDHLDSAQVTALESIFTAVATGLAQSCPSAVSRSVATASVA